MADSKLATTTTTGTTSPPPNCAICLGICTNKCYSDTCMHEFCFSCLLEWSKIKPECPLCKQSFRSIIHNIKSIDEYDEHIVENIRVEEIDPPFVYLPPVTPPPPHQYHFRTTLTVDTRGEHAIQQMLLSHPLITIGTFPPERYPHHRRRRTGDTSTAFRRSIYAQNLWVYAPPDITGRYRDVTPSHYRRDPGARARLVPWLNRELNALLYENTQQVMQLVDIIMDHLLRHHICSRVFRTLLHDYLGNKTDHFIHEFYNFMRSPFDMIGYDRHAIYLERPVSPPSYIDVSDDYDSDVIIVNSTTTPNNQLQQSQQQQQQLQLSPIIIDLVDTDSDEPIIVSEEVPNYINNNNNVNNTNNNTNNNDNSSIDDNTNSSGCSSRNIDNSNSNSSNNNNNNRKPILPLKIRIKNKRKSKEKKSRHHNRKKRKCNISSTSSSSSSSTSSSTSSSSSSSLTASSSDTPTEYECKKKNKCKNKHYRNSKLLKRTDNRKNKRKYNKIINNNKSSGSGSNSDSEDDIPLAKIMKKHKCKYRKLIQPPRGEQQQQQYFNYDQNIIDRLNYSISSSSNENSQALHSVDCQYAGSSNSTRNERSLCDDDDDGNHYKNCMDNCNYNNNNDDDDDDDDDDYYDIKPNVKSEIKIRQNDYDCGNNKLEPSTSNISNNNNTRFKDYVDESNNLWYYRPNSYDKDNSSDN